VADDAGQVDGAQDLNVNRWDEERARFIARRKLLKTMNVRVLAVTRVVRRGRGTIGACDSIRRAFVMIVIVVIAVTMLVARLFEI